jgi:hypothetical protein
VWKLVGNFSRSNSSGRRARARTQNPQLQLQQQRFSPGLLIGSLKINLSLAVMMSAVDPWKPPQPPRRQRVVTKVFCACNVGISDIFGKLVREQAGGVFHPQHSTEYPRHFQRFCTIVNPTIDLNLTLPPLTSGSCLFDANTLII